MGFSTTTAARASGVTPFRKVRLRLDPPIVVSQAPPFGLHRTGHEIARGGGDGGSEDYGSQAVYQLATGAWTLLSVQVEGSYHTERTDNHNSNMQASDLALAADIVSAYRSSKPNTDLTYDGATATASNLMFIKSKPASQPSWNQQIAPVVTPKPPALNGALMGVVAASIATLSGDKAQQFTFTIEGQDVNSPSCCYQYYFGGAAMPDGQGQFVLDFFGNGHVQLYEYVNATWVFRAGWQYAPPGEIVGTHRMLILPHRNATGGGFIQFLCKVVQTAASNGLVTSYHQPASNVASYVYIIPHFALPQTNSSGATVTRANVTGAGKIQIAQKLDMRAWWQPSVLKYLSPGTLVDWPFEVFAPMGNPPYLSINWDAVVPTGCSVVGKLYDAQTNTELTLQSSTSTSRTYRVNVRQPFVYAVFTLAANSDNSQAPTLWSYTITRDSQYTTVSGFETQIINTNASGKIRRVSITGPEKDPTHETASFIIEDLTASLSKLDKRCYIPYILDCTYDPNDQTKRSVLSQGYINRALGTVKGTKAKRGFGSTTARVFPSQDWSSYECSASGEWFRLQASRTFVRLNLALSPDTDSSGSGIKLAFKVTDIVRQMLGYAGYAPDQIDVPDNDIRFFVGTSGSADQLMVEPLTSIGDWIVKTLRSYLGWFLIWDANAGTRGMWRVRPPTLPDSAGNYTPLAKLYTGGPAGKSVHSSATYNNRANTASPGPYVGNGAAPVKTFIRKGSMQKWVRGLEGNAVYVTGTGQLLPNGSGQMRKSQWAYNVKSFNLPGASAADPNDPDYLGWFFPIVVFDPSQNEQAAVDFEARRYYDQACHSVKMLRVTCPAVLVVDPNDPKQTHPRPLRYYDPLTITNKHGVESDWLVRNCSIHFDKSHFMFMTLELEAPRETIV